MVLWLESVASGTWSPGMGIAWGFKQAILQLDQPASRARERAPTWRNDRPRLPGGLRPRRGGAWCSLSPDRPTPRQPAEWASNDEDSHRPVSEMGSSRYVARQQLLFQSRCFPQSVATSPEPRPFSQHAPPSAQDGRRTLPCFPRRSFWRPTSRISEKKLPSFSKCLSLRPPLRMPASSVQASS